MCVAVVCCGYMCVDVGVDVVGVVVDVVVVCVVNDVCCWWCRCCWCG